MIGLYLMENGNMTIEYRYAYSPPGEVTNIRALTQKIREIVAPFRFKLAARGIVRELEIGNKKKILELGSGLGLLGNAIQSRTGGEVNYFGVELAYKSSRASSGNGLIGIQADIGMLPFASNSFDGIVSTDVLEHVLDSGSVAEEMFRVLKPEAKAFVVIADPIEPRFGNVQDHINRNNGPTNVDYWEELFEKKGFEVLRQEAKKYRDSDWRNIFNLPFLVKIRDCPGFACAFNPINRPGVYIIRKPKV